MAQSDNFHKASSTDRVGEIIARKIEKHLIAGEEVLWLVSGGSSVDVAIKAAERLSKINLNRLTVSLADERYGEPGHKDSNWAQLINAGFKLDSANLHPVLEGNGSEQTTDNFKRFIHQAFSANDFRLALLGMGADGHTAGILPHSPAVTSPEAVVCYEGPDYTRITLSAAKLAELDEAIVYVQGQNKHEALGNLAEDLPLDQQPAQIIKRIPSCSVYNDLIGEQQ